MIFSDITFLILIIFLIIINLFIKKNETVVLLIIFSFFILYFNHPKSLLASLVFILIFIFYFFIIKYFKLRKIYPIVFLIFFLIIYKYSNANLDFLKNSSYNVFIPLGISFYTFQGIIYIQDQNKISTKIDFTNFLFYIFFFPQLIAGPICKFHYIINQIPKLFTFKLKNLSLFFILFSIGIIKKVIIADNLRDYIQEINNTYRQGFLLYFFTFCLFYLQIFFDFSGYMNMARSLGKLFNINLPLNFKSPYLSKSPSDFFERWHVTLSNFIKEYIYLNFTRYLFSIGFKLNYAVFTSAFISLIIFGIWHGFNIYYIAYSITLFILFVTWNLFSIDIRFNNFLSILLTQIFIVFAFGFVYLGLEGPIKNNSQLILNDFFSFKEISILISIYLICIIYQLADELIRKKILIKRSIVNKLKNKSFFILSIFIFLFTFILSIKLSKLTNLALDKGFIYFNF